MRHNGGMKKRTRITIAIVLLLGGFLYIAAMGATVVRHRGLDHIRGRVLSVEPDKDSMTVLVDGSKRVTVSYGEDLMGMPRTRLRGRMVDVTVTRYLDGKMHARRLAPMPTRERTAGSSNYVGG